MTKDELWALVQKAKTSREKARKAWEQFHLSNADDGCWKAAMKANDAYHEDMERLHRTVDEEVQG
jgi:hypothetical protein